MFGGGFHATAEGFSRHRRGLFTPFAPGGTGWASRWPAISPLSPDEGQGDHRASVRPLFKLALAAKDASLVEDSAKRHKLDLPLVSTIRKRLEQGKPSTATRT
jgi:hypothetical protein